VLADVVEQRAQMEQFALDVAESVEALRAVEERERERRHVLRVLGGVATTHDAR
jgi:hypothetical protein